MAFRFSLQPALERARADESIARARVGDASRAVSRARATLDRCEARVREVRALPRPGGSAATFAICDGTAVAIRASLDAATASHDDARGVLARERTACDAIARRRLGLERVRERRAEAYRARVDAAEAAELDERNAMPRGRASYESETSRVIALHRANGFPLVVNADLIETIERDDTAETVVTLTTGNVLAVAETPDEVRLLAIAYRRAIGHVAD